MTLPESPSCPICFSTPNDRQFTITKCNHIFCLPCLENHAHRLPSCPLCRHPLNLLDLVDMDRTPLPNDDHPSEWPISGIYQRSSLGGGRHREGVTFDFGIPAIRFSEPHHNCDSSGPLHSLEFDRFRFHRSTMTFRGRVRRDIPFTRVEARIPFYPTYLFCGADCQLRFSSDGRYVREGTLSWFYHIPSHGENYPLDGVWEVEYSGSLERQILNVQFHCFSDSRGRRYTILPGLGLTWMDEESILTHSAEPPLPDSSGPSIGQTLHWKNETNLTWTKDMVWKRIATNLEGVTAASMVNDARSVYRRVVEADAPPGPTYHVDSLWGNTFCQGFTVGLASYHFLPREDGSDDHRAYISYENPRTMNWPDLDNGEAVPSRVSFQNIRWDEQLRIFTGEILWMRDYGTTWTGDSEWLYEIQFDPTFKFIVSGTCARSAQGEPSEFGKDLVYVNAALEDVFRGVLSNNSSTGEYLDVLHRCREDGASELTLRFLGEVALTVLNNDGASSLFDFNL